MKSFLEKTLMLLTNFEHKLQNNFGSLKLTCNVCGESGHYFEEQVVTLKTEDNQNQNKLSIDDIFQMYMDNLIRPTCEHEKNMKISCDDQEKLLIFSFQIQ